MADIGHNSGDGSEMARILAGFAQALEDAHNGQLTTRDMAIILARHMLALDNLYGGNEIVADAKLKSMGLLRQTNVLSNKNERTYARWMARGGSVGNSFGRLKSTNEINDLSPKHLNEIEARFRVDPKFVKTPSYVGVYAIFRRDALKAVKAAIGDENESSLLEDARKAHAHFFEEDTFDKWVEAERYQRSEQYVRLKDAKTACNLFFKVAESDDRELTRVENFFKEQIAQVHKIRAERVQEKVVKEKAAKLTPDQRRTLEKALRNSANADMSPASADDF